jgi:NADH-quinone oxidoreductase subunit A
MNLSAFDDPLLTPATGSGQALLFLAGGLAFAGLIVATARLIGPFRPSAAKNTTYECGEDPFGPANLHFNMRFYLVGLIFLLFDVELLFLFPWVLVIGDPSTASWKWLALGEMFVFIGVLFLGLVYAWAQGDLDWVKPSPTLPERVNPVPDAVYQQFNQRNKAAGK